MFNINIDDEHFSHQLMITKGVCFRISSVVESGTALVVAEKKPTLDDEVVGLRKILCAMDDHTRFA